RSPCRSSPVSWRLPLAVTAAGWTAAEARSNLSCLGRSHRLNLTRTVCAGPRERTRHVQDDRWLRRTATAPTGPEGERDNVLRTRLAGERQHGGDGSSRVLDGDDALVDGAVAPD